MSAGELREALERAIADKENGIILLTEKFGREFPDIVDDVKLEPPSAPHRRNSGPPRYRPEG